MCTNPRGAASPASFRSLNRWLTTALAAALVTFAPFAAAQEAATGTIRGRAQNATNGAYLENVTVQVNGTNRQVRTNSFGEYELTGVPAGEVTLRANYVGEPEQTATVTVPAGAAGVRDFIFRESASTSRLDNGTIRLDPFTVSAERYKNAQAIAIAEERNSVNIKNVVAIDTFGDIPSGNVGEFVKFMPGVQVSYGSFGGNNQGYADSDASGISIRGFGPEDTAILIDGMPVSNATPGSLSRQVGLDQLSINNAARVELIKVATPDMPNNSIGGQVNLVTKSSFEYPKPSYTARVFVNFNSLNTDLGKTPGPTNKNTYKTTPGVEFTVSYPFSRTVGVSFTGYAANEFNQTYRAESTYTTSGSSSILNAAGNPQSVTDPVLSRFKVTDIARMTEKRSGNLRFDWKPSSSQLLRANLQYSTYKGPEAQRRLDARPTIATGADWNGTQTTGTTANSTLDMTVTTRDKVGETKSGQLQYDYKRNGWTLAAAASLSVSTGDFRDRQNGHFSEIGLKLNPGQVRFLNIQNGIPGTIETSNRTTSGGGLRDYTQLANYGFDGTIAKSGEAFSKNTVGLYKLDVERDLSFLKFIGTNSLTFKAGARRDQEKTEKSGLGTGYQEDLIAGKSYLVTDILDTGYQVSPGFGYAAQQWGSPYKLFELNQQNKLFEAAADGSTAVNNYNSYVNQQKSLTDTKDAFYGQLNGRFFGNRLSFVGGLRQESSSRDGKGPFTDSKWNYAKNANGTLYTDNFYKVGVKFDGSSLVRTNADGSTTNITNFLTDTALLSRLTAAGVKYPDHLYGAPGTSLEARKLQLIPLREIHSKVTGKPSYSLSTAFQLTKKIDLKAAWSRSFGLPPLENGNQGILSGSNQFSINENIPVAADGTKGVISIANPNLKPQTSNNWDFEASYYTDHGSKLGVSYYYKTVTDQIQNFSTFSGTPEFDMIMGILGLSPTDYADWRVNTASNSTTKQSTSGYEFEIRQDFGFLGGWGKHFQAFASYAVKNLAEPSVPTPVNLSTPNGTPVTITPTISTIKLTANRFGGAGLQFSSRRFSAQLRGTYRNRNEIARSSLPSVNGVPNFLRRFEPSETRVDINVNYTISKRYSAFVSARDIFNGARKQINKDDLGLLPAYAQAFDYREFGVVWTVGLSGRW